jgi:hypothetical protein
MELRKEFERLSNPHKITAFLIITLTTIILTRIFVQFINPNPGVGTFELHHFDYGIAILLWTSLLVMFGNKKHYAHLLLFGISFGWILDDIIFIRSNVLDPTITEIPIYNSTLPGVIIITGIIFIASVVIWKISKRNSK